MALHHVLNDILAIDTNKTEEQNENTRCSKTKPQSQDPRNVPIPDKERRPRFYQRTGKAISTRSIYPTNTEEEKEMKSKQINIRITDELWQKLQSVKNQSRLIENLLTKHLESETCPFCGSSLDHDKVNHDALVSFRAWLES